MPKQRQWTPHTSTGYLNDELDELHEGKFELVSDLQRVQSVDGTSQIDFEMAPQSKLIIRGDGNRPLIQFFGYNNNPTLGPSFTGVRYRGSVASPLAIKNLDTIFQIRTWGETGSGINEAGNFTFSANQDFSVGNAGGKFELQVTPIGQTSPATALSATGTDVNIPGTLTVPTPTANLHAATKQYVDNAIPTVPAQEVYLTAKELEPNLGTVTLGNFATGGPYQGFPSTGTTRATFAFPRPTSWTTGDVLAATLYYSSPSVGSIQTRVVANGIPLATDLSATGPVDQLIAGAAPLQTTHLKTATFSSLDTLSSTDELIVGSITRFGDDSLDTAGELRLLAIKFTVS